MSSIPKSFRAGASVSAGSRSLDAHREEHAMIEVCAPPDPHPRPPKLQCPPGAADCHFHIYGPPDKYPPAATSEFAVPDALPAACRHMHDVLGIERVVVVQPSGYGRDNRR